MVMDFLEGRSLAEILEAEGKLLVPRALDIFIQISYALAHAHTKGIVHRDIKPSNIMLVESEGQSEFVKIVDFGIAKLVDSSDPNYANLTRTGEVFGSPLYISPEQWRAQKLDGRTDIYSLGSVMYRVVSGRPMYEDNDVLQLMYQHITDMPASFESIGVDIPSELEAIIFKALAKDPDLRYQSMTDVMSALEQFRKSISADRVSASLVSTRPVVDVAAENNLPGLPDLTAPNAEAIPADTGVAAGTPFSVSSRMQARDSNSPETETLPLAAVPAIHFSISKRTMKIGFAVAAAFLGGLLAFLVFGPLHHSEKAPVQESPTQSAPPSEYEYTQPPLIIHSVVKPNDDSVQKRTPAKAAKQHIHKHLMHSARNSNSTVEQAPIPPAPPYTSAQTGHGVTRLKDKIKNFLRKL